MVDRPLPESDNAGSTPGVRSLIGMLVRVAVLFALTAILAKYSQSPIHR
jgi:hypothetical protein